MKIRKALSLLLALVFAVSLVPAFTVTSSAVDYDPPERPVAWWNGTNVEWKPAEGALWYTVYVSYVVEGHDPVTVMDAIVDVDGTTVTEAKNRLGTPVLRACSYDEENGCFVLDASNVIQYENDKYMYRVAAINYKDDTHKATQSNATTGAAILGSELKAGYTARPHTVSVTNGTADRSDAWAGQTVTIRFSTAGMKPGMMFTGWKVESGSVTLADSTSSTTTFTMPNEDVVIRGISRFVYGITVMGGTAKKTEPYSFSWALSDTADLTILQAWVPLENGWRDLGPLSKSPASAEYRSIFTDGNTSKYRIQAEKGGEKFYSDEFTVTWTEDTGEQPNPFVDIKKSDPWYDAVLWAYYADPQVTKGVSDTRFGPTETVTRGQCAAFLWRAMGCPEPTNTVNPFVDVPSSQYYYKPILWAVEKGITQGTSARHFSPNDTLTTAHIITFLYRAKHPGANGWYEEAGAWAEQGYGSGKPFGVNTPVNPKTDCPRGYVVMFLQKAK